MRIEKLEDLEVWQEARSLTKNVYKITKKLPLEERYNLRMHMRQCFRNVCGNIAEGFGRFHYQESMQFYRIARGSLTELKSDTYLTYDANYITEEEFNELLGQIEKVGMLLNGLISSTKKQKGEKNLSNN
jgi:four helix bundle protein